MALMTAIEAYRQAARDSERAEEAVQWFEKQFPNIHARQKEQVRLIVLSLLYEGHIAGGRLPPAH